MGNSNFSHVELIHPRMKLNFLGAVVCFNLTPKNIRTSLFEVAEPAAKFYLFLFQIFMTEKQNFHPNVPVRLEIVIGNHRFFKIVEFYLHLCFSIRFPRS